MKSQKDENDLLKNKISKLNQELNDLKKYQDLFQQKNKENQDINKNFSELKEKLKQTENELKSGKALLKKEKLISKIIPKTYVYILKIYQK